MFVEKVREIAIAFAWVLAYIAGVTFGICLIAGMIFVTIDLGGLVVACSG